MIVVYDSLTGQNKRMANKLMFNHISIEEMLNLKTIDDNIFLLTRSYNFGEIPKSTELFLNIFKDKIIGVAVSGNKNWGDNYGAAGDKIKELYNLNLILKYEGSGFKEDVLFIQNYINSYKKEID